MNHFSINSLICSVTPHVFNLQDYVNHMFKRAKSSMEFKFKVYKFLVSVDQLAQSANFDNLLELN
jgi:hypothetical protein